MVIMIAITMREAASLAGEIGRDPVCRIILDIAAGGNDRRGLRYTSFRPSS
jgi:hypothetical protein